MKREKNSFLYDAKDYIEIKSCNDQIKHDVYYMYNGAIITYRKSI